MGYTRREMERIATDRKTVAFLGRWPMLPASKQAYVSKYDMVIIRDTYVTFLSPLLSILLLFNHCCCLRVGSTCCKNETNTMPPVCNGNIDSSVLYTRHICSSAICTEFRHPTQLICLGFLSGLNA